MSAASTMKCTGASGTQYEFELYPWNTVWRPVPVVYVVLRHDGAQWKVLYVGETGDVKQRFANHERQPCFDRHLKTHLAVRQETSAVRRTAMEKDIMKNYNPPCNREI